VEKMKIRFLFFLCCALSFKAFGNILKADKLFDSGQYASALKSYEGVLNGKETTFRWRALYRAAECESRLQKNEAALERLQKVELPNEPVWKARLLLLRTEIIKNYLNLGYDLLKNTDKKTATEWFELIKNDYEALAPLRKALLQSPLKSEKYFFKIEASDLENTPTFWDFALTKWSAFILGQPSSLKTEKLNTELLFQRQKRKIKNLESLFLLEALWDEAATAEKIKRETAADLWRVKRLLLPLSHPTLMTSKKDLTDHLLVLYKKTLQEKLSEKPKSLLALSTAKLYFQKKLFKEAKETCELILDLAVPEKTECKELVSWITKKEFEIEPLSKTKRENDLFVIKTRNIAQVEARLILTTAEELESVFPNKESKDFSFLRSLPPETVTFLQGKEALSQEKLRIKEDQPFQWKETSWKLPSLQQGIYVALFSTENPELGKSILFPKSALSLFGSQSITPTVNQFNLYALNKETGNPPSDALIKIRFSNSGEKPPAEAQKMPEDGRLVLEEKSSSQQQLDPLLEFEKSSAWLAAPLGQEKPREVMGKSSNIIKKGGKKQGKSYEITLDPLTHPLSYGSKIEITGKILPKDDSSGNPIKLRYKITKTLLSPSKVSFSPYPQPEEETLAYESLFTSTSGGFKIPLTVEPFGGKEDQSSDFGIEIEALDPAGKLLSTETHYVCNPEPFLFEWNAPSYFEAGKPIQADIKMQAVDFEFPLEVSGTYQIAKLFPNTGFLQNLNWKDRVSKWKNKEITSQGKFQAKTDTPFNFQSKTSLSPGLYRLILKVENSSAEKDFIFAVIKPDKPLSSGLMDFNGRDKNHYTVGEEGTLILGSAQLKGMMGIEIWKNKQLLGFEWLEAGLISYKLPILDDYQGGIDVRWFGTDGTLAHSEWLDVPVAKIEKAEPAQLH
jgi:hypothetical protein